MSKAFIRDQIEPTKSARNSWKFWTLTLRRTTMKMRATSQTGGVAWTLIKYWMLLKMHRWMLRPSGNSGCGKVGTSARRTPSPSCARSWRMTSAEISPSSTRKRSPQSCAPEKFRMSVKMCKKSTSRPHRHFHYFTNSRKKTRMTSFIWVKISRISIKSIRKIRRRST